MILYRALLSRLEFDVDVDVDVDADIREFKADAKYGEDKRLDFVVQFTNTYGKTGHVELLAEEGLGPRLWYSEQVDGLWVVVVMGYLAHRAAERLTLAVEKFGETGVWVSAGHDTDTTGTGADHGWRSELSR